VPENEQVDLQPALFDPKLRFQDFFQPQTQPTAPVMKKSLMFWVDRNWAQPDGP